MEQRAELRFVIDQPVAVLVLGGKEIRETARVRNVSPAGLQLLSDRVIPAGSAIKIELDNSLALGEVMYCVAEGEQYVLGIKLEHILNGLAELQRKLMAFAGEPLPEPAK
ncbi:MAG: PilZ domain-containing protein [Acidobacteriia bacterium]|nr:PilZ domain-containing protein [Terriglobia bacterium]